MLTRTVLVFLASAVVILVAILAHTAEHAGAITGRALLLVLEEATAMAFIPAALYVVFRLVRR